MDGVLITTTKTGKRDITYIQNIQDIKYVDLNTLKITYNGKDDIIHINQYNSFKLKDRAI